MVTSGSNMEHETIIAKSNESPKQISRLDINDFFCYTSLAICKTSRLKFELGNPYPCGCRLQLKRPLISLSRAKHCPALMTQYINRETTSHPWAQELHIEADGSECSSKLIKNTTTQASPPYFAIHTFH